MKKLMTTVAASLMAVGFLYADNAPALVESLVDFDNYGSQDIGSDLLLNGADEFSRDQYYLWYTTGTESWVVKNSVSEGDNADLFIETEKGVPLFRTLADLGEPPAEGEDTRTMSAVTPEKNVVFDTKICFTGFEEAPVPTAVDKILVWMKATENSVGENDEIVAGETNLYVTASVLAENNTVVTNHFKVNIENVEFEVGKEYQITVKSIGNIWDAENSGIEGTRIGFLVYVDGTLIANSDDNAAALGAVLADSEILGKYEDLMDYIFPSLTNDLTLKAVGFEGTGSIDDLAIAYADNDELCPEFAKDASDEPVDPPAPTVDPIAPGATKECADADVASDVADIINAAKATYITAPTGIEAAAYSANFEAVANGNVVSIQLTYDATTNLQSQADNEVTAASIISAALDSGYLTIKGTPGFYYSVSSTDDLDDGFTESARVRADAEGDVENLEVPQYEGSGFYKLNVNIAPKQ